MMDNPEDAMAELIALHRNDELAARYPQVKALLAGLSETDLANAGQLLARLDPDEVQTAHPGVNAVTIGVTGHGTLPGLVPALTAELARHGLLLRPVVADFDGYLFELADPDSAVYAADPQIVLAVLDPTVVSDELPVPWRPDDVARVLDQKIAVIERLCAQFERACKGTLVLNTMPLPRTLSAQLIDHRSRARLGAIWRDGNARLLRLADEHPSLVVLDLDTLVADGVPIVDERLNVYAKAHLSVGLLARYAREIGHLGAHVAGRTRKCLVLDLDGTVWGGVLGDDGVDGIEVGESYRGEAFSAFQRVAKQIGSQGVLLAAASKNDADAVAEVLRDHPRMTLREDDLVRVAANWRPKHDNLIELAEDLNLNVDSFVFVDDNPAERGLVGAALPEVAVVEIGQDPAGHVGALLRDGWFDVRELTTEDRARPARYRDELARKDFLSSHDSIQDYLRELNVTVRISAAGEHEIARISQITLRTNQFNLTTERLQPSDVAGRAADRAHLVLGIHVADRFGASGLVGAVFTRAEGDTLHIDNFLLSCRVFSRGVEQATLSSIQRYARDAGIREVVGAYRPSPKNGKVRDFYPRHGFVPLDDEGGDVTRFRHDLAEILPVPGHLRLTETFREADGDASPVGSATPA
jgi:FkbH-like protein